MNISLSISISNKILSSGITPPLDDYTGAQTAYSIARKLRTAYTGDAIRVRADNELVTNGDFPTDTTGWVTGAFGSISVVSGQLEVLNNTANSARAKQTVVIESGKTYQVSIDFQYVDVNGAVTIGSTSGGSDYMNSIASSDTLRTATFTATGTSAYIALINSTNDINVTSLWDNVSIMEVTDIGFDANGDLDETALLAHTGSNSGYVVTAYDQSGNGNDWTQATANKQPRIVNAGTVEKVNGKPAIYSDATDDNLSLSITGVNPTTAFHVYKQSRAITIINHAGVSYNYGRSQSGDASVSYNNSGTPSIYVNGSIIGGSRGDLYTATYGNQVITVHEGLNLSAPSWNKYETDFSSSGAVDSADYIQETIIYDSDKSSDRAAIETNINDYYTIY